VFADEAVGSTAHHSDRRLLGQNAGAAVLHGDQERSTGKVFNVQVFGMFETFKN
jgi:hypothetical protein